MLLCRTSCPKCQSCPERAALIAKNETYEKILTILIEKYNEVAEIVRKLPPPTDAE